jgi:hypothetical protein
VASIERLYEELEAAWDRLQQAHLSMFGALVRQDQRMTEQLYEAEQVARAYFDVVHAVEKERKRFQSPTE